MNDHYRRSITTPQQQAVFLRRSNSRPKTIMNDSLVPSSSLTAFVVMLLGTTALTATTIDAFTASSSLVGHFYRYRYSVQQEQQQPQQQQQHRSSFSRLCLFAPPGSGYARPEDDPGSELPATYEPMMAFPGTMRPGKTPENMPFQDLPIGDDDPDPVPWPHFQQIEWHHRWSEPPHEHPGTMEDFIEALGRWATPEQEASMRAGVRRDVRQRQELAEAGKRETVITDDNDDDDDDYVDQEEPVALGDGIFGRLGSDADRAATAAAVSPDAAATVKDDDTVAATAGDGMFVDDDLDDFLLDLGLDAELEGDDDVDVVVGGIPLLEQGDDDNNDGDAPPGAVRKTGISAAAFSVDDELISLDLDVDDDDDDLEGDAVSTVPLEDFGDSDSLDVEDIFDEGGFDYDDGDFGGGDDVW